MKGSEREFCEKDIPSLQDNILDNCFAILTGNVSYEPLKLIYGFRDKLCKSSGKHCLPWNPTKRSPNMALSQRSLETESLGPL